MKVIVLENAYEISKQAAEIYIKQINKDHGSVLGFATGASPVETYKRIIEAYEKGEVSLKHITTFNLDEYADLDRENVNSYYYFMKDNLFGKTDVNFDKVNFLAGVKMRRASEYGENNAPKHNRCGDCGELRSVNPKQRNACDNKARQDFGGGEFCFVDQELTDKANRSADKKCVNVLHGKTPF